jgi:hypothetical protein
MPWRRRIRRRDRAVEILKSMLPLRSSDFVFPGMKANRPLSVMALEMVLRRMKVDATVHGFRSAFRDWTGERTAFRERSRRLHWLTWSVTR